VAGNTTGLVLTQGGQIGPGRVWVGGVDAGVEAPPKPGDLLTAVEGYASDCCAPYHLGIEEDNARVIHNFDQSVIDPMSRSAF
jgi:hypothetical protein